MTYLLTEVADRERLANQSRVISLGTWAASIMLIGFALAPGIRSNPLMKTVLILAGCGMTAVSRATAGNLATHDRVLQDFRDISDNQRQQLIYEALSPKQLLKDAEPVTVDTQPVEAIAPAVEPETENGLPVRHDWKAVFGLIRNQDEYPAVVVIGPQGTGKTTLIDYLVSIAGRKTKVFDPHYIKGSWPGCVVIGAGMDYDAISVELKAIKADVERRYQELAKHGRYQGDKYTLILEEQTNWGNKVKGANDFLQETLSDIRKVGYQSIAVSHGETNAARGGSRGTAKMRTEGELKIKLLEKGVAEISLKGRDKFILKFPDPSPYTVHRPAVAAKVLAPGDNGLSSFWTAERKATYDWLSKREKPASVRDLCRAGFAQRMKLSADDVGELMGALVALGFALETEQGYSSVKVSS